MSSPQESSEPEWLWKERIMENSDEKSLLFAALDSFYQYARTASYHTTHLRRTSFYALPQAHIALLSAPPFSYLDSLNAVDDAIGKNVELAMAIHKHGLDTFGIPAGSKEWQGAANASDMEKARSTLRQFYRDWSEEGKAERQASLDPVIQDLLRHCSAPSSRVLVPGAGLSRLVHDLRRMGFAVEGVEISFHQLLASSYILNHCPKAGEHTIYPWIHQFSNHLSRAQHLQAVRVPDINPSTIPWDGCPGSMGINASDFLCSYGSDEYRGYFDAVATVFFIDTAPNIIRYIETVKNCLKPGGVWANNGPLLWHFENNPPPERDSTVMKAPDGAHGIGDPGSVELTNDEVMALVEILGFRIEASEVLENVGYIQCPQSMFQCRYKTSHWVARKV